MPRSGVNKVTEIVFPVEAFDEELEAFDRQRLAVFSTLVKELVTASANPEGADFGRIFRHTQHALGMSDLQMSQIFRVIRPTIGRWTNGVTKPHPMARKTVFDALLNEVKNHLKGAKQSA